jgi:hypothetical protein
MAVRPPGSAIAATALLLAMAPATEPAEAATVLGSTDLAGAHNGFACAGCPSGSVVGFRQFALQGAAVEAPEAGVLVSARAFLRRIAGTRQAEIAVLRPGEGIGGTISGTAPLPASSPGGAPEQVTDLRLPVEAGDSLALLLPAGQVDLGIRTRPSPDGAVVSFVLPCTLCGSDGGTGRELLFQGRVEPDADGDLLGDDTQDPDIAFDEGILEEEELFEDEFFEEEFGSSERGRPRLRLLRSEAGCRGGATLLLATPRPGRLTATATAGRHLTIASGRARSTRAGRVRLHMHPTRSARRLPANRRRVRTRVEVSFRPRRGRTQVVTDVLTLRFTRDRRTRSRTSPRTGRGRGSAPCDRPAR